VKSRKPREFSAKTRDLAKLTGIDLGQLDLDPLDLDPTAAGGCGLSSGGLNQGHWILIRRPRMRASGARRRATANGDHRRRAAAGLTGKTQTWVSRARFEAQLAPRCSARTGKFNGSGAVGSGGDKEMTPAAPSPPCAAPGQLQVDGDGGGPQRWRH
jgi:hypothetical protein